MLQASPITRSGRVTESPAPRRRRISSQTVLVHVVLAVVFLVATLPILALVSGSLQTITELYRGVHLLPATPQWSNYAFAWNEGNFRTYLPNSALYATSAVVGILLVASMAGYALARIDFPGRRAVTFLILALMIVPLPASFIALYKLMINIGLENTRTGYVLVLIAGGLPVSTLIMRGFFVRQPKELEEAALLDGASALGVFWRIMLPLAKPGLAAVAVIQFLRSWNEYLLALVLFTDEEKMPVQRGLTKFVASDTPEQHILLAATAMSVVPIVVLYAVMQRHIIRGIMEGAIKG